MELQAKRMGQIRLMLKRFKRQQWVYEKRVLQKGRVLSPHLKHPHHEPMIRRKGNQLSIQVNRLA